LEAARASETSEQVKDILCENIKDDYYRRQRKLFQHNLVRSEKWAYAFLAMI